MLVEQAVEQLQVQAPGRWRQGRPIVWRLTLFGVGILVPVLMVAAIVAIHFAPLTGFSKVTRDVTERKRYGTRPCLAGWIEMGIAGFLP